jgi:hypothetical protein
MFDKLITYILYFNIDLFKEKKRERNKSKFIDFRFQNGTKKKQNLTSTLLVIFFTRFNSIKITK